MTAEQAADYVATEKGAIESACWFWNAKKLNDVADTQDIVKMTKIINGGDIGLADRQARYKKAMEVFGGKVALKPVAEAASESAATATLKKGSKGELVKKMQAVLGLSADGDFGPGTEAALKKWQASKGLTADGVAGPKTLAAMGIK
jgi:putative chitinase